MKDPLTSYNQTRFPHGIVDMARSATTPKKKIWNWLALHAFCAPEKCINNVQNMIYKVYKVMWNWDWNTLSLLAFCEPQKIILKYRMIWNYNRNMLALHALLAPQTIILKNRMIWNWNKNMKFRALLNNNMRKKDIKKICTTTSIFFSLWAQRSIS